MSHKKTEIEKYREQVEKLTNEQISNRAKLLLQNGKLISDVRKSYAGSSGAVQGALMTGVDKAIVIVT